jgi:hypothetical protein
MSPAMTTHRPCNAARADEDACAAARTAGAARIGIRTKNRIRRIVALSRLQ